MFSIELYLGDFIYRCGTGIKGVKRSRRTVESEGFMLDILYEPDDPKEVLAESQKVKKKEGED